MARQYWLMKSEPEVYSISSLKKDKRTLWTGVRNYQARNFMTQAMQVGDEVLFYHSSADPTGVAGIARVSKIAVPDPSQFDKKAESFEPKATQDKPIWFCVEVEFVKELPQLVTLDALRSEKSLTDMQVLKKGQRLSIQPVTEKEFKKVSQMGGA